MHTLSQRYKICQTFLCDDIYQLLLCAQPHEEISFDSNKNENSERLTYIVISIPGLNNWAKEKSTDVQKSDTMGHNSNNSKRSLDENDVEEMDCSESVTKKGKTLSDTDVDMNDTDSSTKLQGILSEEHILNFPIPIDGGKACIVKVFI